MVHRPSGEDPWGKRAGPGTCSVDPLAQNEFGNKTEMLFAPFVALTFKLVGKTAGALI